ncbi:hypothetical protein Trydic_g17628 [Trypoxylus dichotomus]
MNGSLVERARAVINDAEVPNRMWGEAIRTTTYILNRSPIDALNSNATPTEIWNKRKPNAGNLKVFESMAYTYLHKEHRDKFDSKMEKCVIENDTAQTRSKRHVKPPSKYDDYEQYMAFDAVNFIEDVPKTYYDLEHRPDKVLWVEATKKELDSINKNNIWEIEEKPKDTKMLDTKWVYALKQLEQDDNNKYKAKVVARGFTQDKDNYDDLYLPGENDYIAFAIEHW